MRPIKIVAAFRSVIILVFSATAVMPSRQSIMVYQFSCTRALTSFLPSLYSRITPARDYIFIFSASFSRSVLIWTARWLPEGVFLLGTITISRPFLATDGASDFGQARKHSRRRLSEKNMPRRAAPSNSSPPPAIHQHGP